jgi:hypothetical protein
LSRAPAEAGFRAIARRLTATAAGAPKEIVRRSITALTSRELTFSLSAVEPW